MPKTKMRGLTTVESLLIAAAFIIVGVIGLLTFQGMGKSAAESLRANAIVTADRAGFDVTVEVLNGRLSGVLLAYGESGWNLGASIPWHVHSGPNGGVQHRRPVQQHKPAAYSWPVNHLQIQPQL
jgi:hypothetical protein